MRNKKSLAALAASLMMIASATAPAWAATTYTPVAGTSTTFEKYLIMDAGDNVPNVTFSFTVAPGTAQAAVPAAGQNGATMAVLAGLGTPTIQDVTFAQTDSTSTTTTGKIDLLRAASTRANGLDASTGVQFEASSGEKFASHTATIDFSGISFPEPGIYRYIVSETASAADEAAGIMHDNDTDRVLDVYVTDDGTGALVVSGYVMHTDAGVVAANASGGSADVTNAGDALADKTDGFTNEFMGSKDLVFKKEVTGNQASRDKYFKFTASVNGINDDDIYTVSLADDADANTTDGNADASPAANAATIYSSMTNPTSVTGAQLKAGVDFYLQHGQSVAIRGIAPNATYSVIEAPEDYISAASAVTGYTDATATGANETIDDIAGDDDIVLTSYQNTRSGVVPTGIMLATGAGIAAVAAGVGGVIVSKRKKRSKED